MTRNLRGSIAVSSGSFFSVKLVFVTLLMLGNSLALGALPVPAPPTSAASSYLLIDFHSEDVLAEKSADARIEPASITKIMTGYVLYRALAGGKVAESDQVTVSKKAWKMEGSRMFIEVGKQVLLSDLMKGMTIQSGNDASVAIAEHVAGSEEVFVSMMNAEAERLGMNGSHYMNATGLPDPQHYTTARDIYRLTRALIEEFPQRYKLYSQREFHFNDIKQSNRNRMLWLDKRVDGVKTGHTDSAGYCLVSSATEGDMRLISVVLGTKSDTARTDTSRSLLNYGFRFFETRKLYSASGTVAQAKVWKGETDQLALGIPEDVYVTFPRGQFDKLNAVLDRPKVLEAPIKAGQVIGSVTITLDGATVHKLPLNALNSVKDGGFLRRTIDSGKLWLED